MKATNGKEVKTKYGFTEYYNMDNWLKDNPQYRMVNYKFTFAYGYILYYTEK